jgi:hypothetical protein
MNEQLVKLIKIKARNNKYKPKKIKNSKNKNKMYNNKKIMVEYYQE